MKGRNIILKNQDLKFLIKNSITTQGSFYFMSLLLKYATTDKTGARTNHQLSNLFELLMYVTELTLSKSNIEENQDKISNYSDYKIILALITSGLKQFTGMKEKTKEIKTIVKGMLNFLSKFTSLYKLVSSSFSSEEKKLFSKSVVYITGILKDIFSKHPELKGLSDKNLEIEEEYSK